MLANIAYLIFLFAIYSGVSIYINIILSIYNDIDNQKSMTFLIHSSYVESSSESFGSLLCELKCVDVLKQHIDDVPNTKAITSHEVLYVCQPREHSKYISLIAYKFLLIFI